MARRRHPSTLVVAGVAAAAAAANFALRSANPATVRPRCSAREWRDRLWG